MGRPAAAELEFMRPRGLEPAERDGSKDERERMSADQDVASFISSSFRSVWAIELLLHLKRNQEHDWSTADLVQAMRASELVVSSGLASLLSAGLVVQDASGASRYAPASPEIERLAEATEALYAKKPDAVRRIIVTSASDGVAAFADAFRLRRE
jgi:hypothetical protein